MSFFQHQQFPERLLAGKGQLAAGDLFTQASQIDGFLARHGNEIIMLLFIVTQKKIFCDPLAVRQVQGVHFFNAINGGMLKGLISHSVLIE